MRPYQQHAALAWEAAGAGVVVLPCGSGKTIVGLAAIAAQGCETLIVTSNAASLGQWRDELLARTTVVPEAVGEYSSQAKEIRPITLTTYQMLTHRPRRDEGFPHLDLFERREWGLVIYDEVHLLPAPVFRATARIQARRRLGLTATLIRPKLRLKIVAFWLVSRGLRGSGLSGSWLRELGDALVDQRERVGL